ncbi:MAG: murein biosynthesis integral membrane protein MurJ [Acidiferrobacteraceae bacterium]
MAAKLFKSTLVTGGMTTISRISGFVRDMMLARLVGTTPLADAFFVAFRIPNFLRRIFGEGAFSQAFVPVFSGYRVNHNDGEAKQFLDNVAGTMTLVLMGVALVGVVAAPAVVFVLAPGFFAMPAKYHLTVVMLRITFPYLMFISLVAMSAGVLNTCGYFAVPAFTPVLLNLSLIGAAWWLAPHLEHPVLALAWGVLIGGAAQFLFQVPFLLRLGFLPRPRIGFAHEGVKRIFRLMLPALFGASVAQINLVVDTVLASFLKSGSVSWLYYSNRLLEFPLGVFGIALGTVILPSLSEKHARLTPDTFSHTIDWALRWVATVTVPAAVGLAVLGGPLLSTLFQYGAFTPYDVTMTLRSLIAFSVGLPAFVMIKILAPGYYARQDTKTPVRIGVIALLTNIVFNLILVWPLAHAGLALATSLSGVLNAGLLLRGLRGTGVYQPAPGWWLFLAKVSAGAVLMGALLYWGAGDLSVWMRRTGAERALSLSIWIMTGFVVYVTVLWLFQTRLRLSPEGEGPHA